MSVTSSLTSGGRAICTHLDRFTSVVPMPVRSLFTWKIGPSDWNLNRLELSRGLNIRSDGAMGPKASILPAFRGFCSELPTRTRSQNCSVGSRRHTDALDIQRRRSSNRARSMNNRNQFRKPVFSTTSPISTWYLSTRSRVADIGPSETGSYALNSLWVLFPELGASFR